MGRYADRHGRPSSINAVRLRYAGRFFSLSPATPSYEKHRYYGTNYFSSFFFLPVYCKDYHSAESNGTSQHIYLKWLVVVAVAFIQASNM